MYGATQFYENPEDAKNRDNEYMHGLISKLKPSTLLEIGSGNWEMLSRYPNSIGIDLDSDMVNFAVKQGKNVLCKDITDSLFATSFADRFDVVVANYVFTQLPSFDLDTAFSNIRQLLKKDGTFFFTITNPRIRDEKNLPGYRVVFEKSFNYWSIDVPFTVLLESKSGEFIDVGIRDYHNPAEVYQDLLSKAGFKNISMTGLNYGYGFDHALLFEVK